MLAFASTGRSAVMSKSIASEGWIRVPVGKTMDRKGNPLTIKLKGKTEPFFRD